jgi:hypothetical protein
VNILAKEKNLQANKGRGRPKGSQNKVSRAAKDAIAEAAENLGGSERIVAWAQEAPENERAFWSTIYPKLIAVQVDANHSGQVVAQVVFKGLNADG